MLQGRGMPHELPAEIRAQTERGGWRGELTKYRKDGSELLINLNTSLIRD